MNTPDVADRILVVDDDDLVSSALRRALEREGYEVFPAASLDEALSTFRSHGADVVLTDLLMPGGSGIDLLREIEQIDPLVPVVIITADDSVDSAAEAVRTRAYDYLSKPVSRNDLRRVVAKALSERRHSQARQKAQKRLRKDHRALEIQLEQRKNILGLVFDRTAEGIVIWDRDCAMVDVSGSFLDLTGLDECRARACTIDEIFEHHPAEGPISLRVEKLLSSPDPGGHWTGEVSLRVPKGVALTARLRVYTCDVPGSVEDPQRTQTRYAVGLLHYDEAREQLSHQLQRADRLASTAVLAGSAAHEIKNDLGPLLGYLSMLDTGDDSHIVPTMRNSVHRIREHIDQILAPLRARKRNPAAVGLAAVVRSTLEDLRRAGTLRRIDLRVECPQREILVLADRDELHQIVTNLVTNAVDSLGDGGGGRRGAVHVEISARGQGVELIIRDDGIGIAPEDRAHIFEPFFTTKGRHGTGLGLPVVRDIVRNSHGTVTLESEAGVGTTVVVGLPILGQPTKQLGSADGSRGDSRDTTLHPTETNHGGGPSSELAHHAVSRV